MAVVYRARDKRLERDVAMKLMHPHLAEQPNFTERFNKEARAAARLSSPYAVSVFDQGVWGLSGISHHGAHFGSRRPVGAHSTRLFLSQNRPQNH